MPTHHHLNPSHLLSNFGGTFRNDLNNLLSLADEDNDFDISSFSPYVTIQQLPAYVGKYKEYFSVITINCQCINAKFDKLKVVLSNLVASHKLEFTVILIQESWIQPTKDKQEFDDILSSFALPGYQQPYGIPASSSAHGGLICYIKDGFDVSIVHEHTSSKNFESIFLQISGNNLKPTLVGNIYRPPRRNNNNEVVDQFLAEFLPIFTPLSNRYKCAILAGDINLDNLHVNQREKYGFFLNSMLALGYVPKITLPTRFAKYSASLLDQIFVKDNDLDSPSTKSGILFSSISDHLAPFTFLQNKIPENKSPKFVTVTKQDKASVNNFVKSLAESKLIEKIDRNVLTDPNITQHIIESEIKIHYDKHFPTERARFNKYKHKKTPWMTSGILTSIKQRDKIYYKLKCCNPNTPEYNATKFNYDSCSKAINKLIKLRKQEYYSHEFDKHKNDIKKTWSTINSVLGRKSKRNFPNFIYSNDSKIYDKNKIVRELNDYFSTIGENLSAEIPKVNKSFNTYLTKTILTSFSFELVAPSNVSKIMNNLKPKTSTGDDKFNAKIMKLSSAALIEPITILINQSLTTGIFPARYKMAKVMPLIKKPNNFNIVNFRPISLLCAISKVIEKCVFTQVYSYFEKHKLLYESQYGYRKQHSTETACLDLIDKIYQQLDNNQIPFCLFLNLSKAFNTLDHIILIAKLKYYGLDESAITWFQSYLCNRFQYVEVDGIKSEPRRVNTGVPQGSILGPLLFIIYMNDINHASNIFQSILYADDTSLNSTMSIFSNGSHEPLSPKINAEINLIFEWLSANKLSLNVGKTKYMIFRYPQTPLSKIPKLELSVNGVVIKKG